MLFELAVVGLLGVITILLFCILNKDLCLQYSSVRSRLIHLFPPWLRFLVFPPGNTKGTQTLSSHRWKNSEKRYQDLPSQEGVFEWDTRDIQTATDFWLPPIGVARIPENFGPTDLYRGWRIASRPREVIVRLPTDPVEVLPEPSSSTTVARQVVPFSGRPARLQDD